MVSKDQPIYLSPGTRIAFWSRGQGVGIPPAPCWLSSNKHNQTFLATHILPLQREIEYFEEKSKKIHLAGIEPKFSPSQRCQSPLDHRGILKLKDALSWVSGPSRNLQEVQTRTRSENENRPGKKGRINISRYIFSECLYAVRWIPLLSVCRSLDDRTENIMMMPNKVHRRILRWACQYYVRREETQWCSTCVRPRRAQPITAQTLSGCVAKFQRKKMLTYKMAHDIKISRRTRWSPLWTFTQQLCMSRLWARSYAHDYYCLLFYGVFFTEMLLKTSRLHHLIVDSVAQQQSTHERFDSTYTCTISTRQLLVLFMAYFIITMAKESPTNAG